VTIAGQLIRWSTTIALRARGRVRTDHTRTPPGEHLAESLIALSPSFVRIFCEIF
jgi:hypothetical protein